MQVGEPVFAVGNPQGLEGTFSQGIVSSIRKIGSDTLLQITAPISSGSSGGPVLNERGEVIGVSVATFESGQNLNFAIPSNYLKELLTKTGPPKSLVPSNPDEAVRSILSDFSGNITEGITGERFLWSYFTEDGIKPETDFTFTIHNHLRTTVTNIYGLVIFYDPDNIPIDVIPFNVFNMIPASLAKRIRVSADFTTKAMSTKYKGMMGGLPQYALKPDSVEFRILDFEIVD